MSQRIRRSLVVAGLAVAFFMAVPIPSRAAGWGEEAGLASFFEKIWGWVENFVPGRPDSSWDKEGSMINPDGQPTPASTAASSPAGDGGR
jgi:hypothetical protein